MQVVRRNLCGLGLRRLFVRTVDDIPPIEAETIGSVRHLIYHAPPQRFNYGHQSKGEYMQGKTKSGPLKIHVGRRLGERDRDIIPNKPFVEPPEEHVRRKLRRVHDKSIKNDLNKQIYGK